MFDSQLHRRALGCAMVSSKRAVQIATTLGGDGHQFFPDLDLAKVYTAIYELVASSRTVDLVTVSDLCERKGGVNPTLLASCAEEGLSGDYEHDLKQIITEYQWGELRRAAEALAQVADERELRGQAGIKTPHDAIKQLLAKYEQLISATEKRSTPVDAAMMSTRAEEYLRIVNRGKPTGWQVGIPSIDRQFRFANTGLYIIGAESKSGKSKLMVWLARRFSGGAEAGRKVPVYYRSLEMPKEQLWDWIVSLELGINSNLIGTEKMPRDVIDDLLRPDDPLYAATLTIDDDPESTLAGLSLRVREWKIQHKIKGRSVVLLDFVQLMQEYTDRQRGQTSADAVKKIGYGLSRLAKREDLILIAAAQLNREAHSAPLCGTEHLEGGNGFLQAAQGVVILDNLSNRKALVNIGVHPTAVPIWYQVQQRGDHSWRGKIVVDFTTGSWRDAAPEDEELIETIWNAKRGDAPWTRR